MDNKKASTPVILGVLAAVTLIAAFLAIRFGSSALSLKEVWDGLLRQNPDSAATKILWVVRLPHTAACLLAGVGLAVSGVLLQNATNNPLAGPNIIGVNAGAGFAMVLGMCFFPMAYRLFPLIAFAGAFLCTALILLVAGKAGSSRVSIVLSGVAVSTLLNAGISLLRLLFPDMAALYSYFSVGGVSGVSFEDLLVPGIFIGVATILAFFLAGQLNLLCLGDALAKTLGIRVKLLRTVALLLASACASAAVSFAGLLGFVGLMVPHIARYILRSSDLRKLLPVSALLGGTLVTLADLLGRTLFAPSQIPAGIFTALIGAPFFFALLLQRRNRL